MNDMHLALLGLAAIWLLLAILFKHNNQWKMFIDPQKFLLSKFMGLILFIIVLPFRKARIAVNKRSREILLVCYGSVANSLIVVIYHLYK